MRQARGNHRTIFRGRRRRLITSLLACGLTLGLLATPVQPTSALSLFGEELAVRDQTGQLDPELSEQNVEESNGTIQPTSPAAMRSSTARLTWTHEANDVTFDIRVALTNEQDENGELRDIGKSQDGLTEPRYALESIAEGSYAWQVRECRYGACSEWSAVWTVEIDDTKPQTPVAKLISSETDQIVRIGGSSEPGTVVTTMIGESRCQSTTDSDGSWDCEFDEAFDYGSHTAVITASDGAGNDSAQSELMFDLREAFVATPITSGTVPSTLEMGTIEQTLDDNVVARSPRDQVDVIPMTTEPGGNNPVEQLSTEGGLVQASTDGWRVLGVPWFYWIGGASGVMGSWWTIASALGIRRLGFLGM